MGIRVLASCLAIICSTSVVAKAATSCEGLFGSPSGVSIWAKVPEDVRPKLEKAFTQIFRDGQPLMGSWNQMGLRGLREMGIEDAQIKTMTGSRLTDFMIEIREIDLLTKRPELETEENSGLATFNGLMAKLKVTSRPLLFAEKYKLDRFDVLIDRQQVLEGQVDILRNPLFSAVIAFDMARETGRNSEANEIFDRTLQLRGYREALEIAEKYRNDAKLLRTAHVALADFFYGSHRSHLVKTAIEALKRLEGPKQSLAHEMLFDLATELTSRAYLEEAARATKENIDLLEEKYDELALLALRSIGQFEKKIWIDSSSWNYIFLVSDPRVRTAMEKILKRDPNIPGALYARYSLGAREDIYDETIKMIVGISSVSAFDDVRLKSTIEERLILLADNRLNGMYLGKAMSFMKSESLVAQKDKVLAEMIYDYRAAADAAFQFAVKIGMETDSLLEINTVREAFAQNLRRGRGWSKVRPLQHLKARMLEYLKDLKQHARKPKKLDWLDQQETLVRSELMQAKGLSEEKRSEERFMGQQSFRKAYYEQDYLTAYEHFVRAGDRENVLVMADALIARGHGQLALRPLLAASLMPAKP